ncbi:MAG: ABC transporter substrate-binding protein [Bacteroidota bacterium]
MEQLKLALDWTVNTNHTGFFVAQEKGFYREEGIQLEISTPALDNYKKTPAKKVELGEAHMALCPFESVLSYNTKEHPFDAVALATIFREDVSAVVSLGNSGIQSPKDLDNRVYASYQARYEDSMIRQMIMNDGGQGNIDIIHPEKLGIWETLLKGKCDATWIFLNWEGVHASAKGIGLNAFAMADYGVPYGYSPVIMTNRNAVDSQRDTYMRFLKATKKGFLYVQEHPGTGVSCISPHIAKSDSDIDLLQSQIFSNAHYGHKDNWGIMEKGHVEAFLQWLYKIGLEKKRLDYGDLVFEGLWDAI